MHESSDLSLTAGTQEAPLRWLKNAHSITLLIHGVGSATSQGLLQSASDGYVNSELGGVVNRVVLAECPTLTGRTGPESLVIQAASGLHFIVALPWAERRTRLSSVATWGAILLAVLTVTMSLTFVFRGSLEWLEQWLGSWWHRLVAYAVMTAFSFVVYLFRDTGAEFKRPSMGYLLLPPFLLLGLLLFVAGTWLWIATAALVVGLWLISTLIVGRCLLIAPTLGWRVALGALLVAMSLPSAAIVRIARHSATRADEQSRAADSTFASPLLRLPPSVWETLERETHVYDPAESAAAQPPAPGPLRSEAEKSRRHSHEKQGSKRETHPVNRPSLPAKSLPPARDYDVRAQADAVDALLNDREGFMNAVSKYKPSVVDLVREPEFLPKLVLAAICVAVCVFVMSFHWLLDFAFDVLHYGGNQKHRTSLIEATTNAIRWLHEQAPNASIVVVGHSLGSAVAAQSIASIAASESWVNQIVLVTLGSPLNYIGRVFPTSIPRVRELAEVICAGGVRWINLWRRSDPIGRFLDIGESSTVQYCVEKGGHMGYWSRGAVWEAVGFHALGLGEGSAEKAIAGNNACLLERRMGLLVFCSIAALSGCGGALWLLRV